MVLGRKREEGGEGGEGESVQFERVQTWIRDEVRYPRPQFVIRARIHGVGAHDELLDRRDRWAMGTRSGGVRKRLVPPHALRQ